MPNLKKRAPAEDIFHRIQEPVAPAANEPFVGNESVDDDLFECVKVALSVRGAGDDDDCDEGSIAGIAGHHEDDEGEDRGSGDD